MSLRRYVDPTGAEWNVWDVPPRYSPKRSGVDRRTRSVSEFHPERRMVPDRRVTKPPAEWVHGWITFQNETEKLRLCPLPPNWETAADEELENYRQKAKPVSRLSSRA